MFFRGMKINKNYENQLLAFGSVLETVEWGERKRRAKGRRISVVFCIIK